MFLKINLTVMIYKMQKNESFCILFLICAIFVWNLTAAAAANYTIENNNLERSNPLNRDKRFILWENGGISKLVAGFLVLVELGDKKPWRTLSCGYNFQAQYAVPTAPIYPWDKFGTRSLKDVKEQYEKTGVWMADESRRLIYFLIEQYSERTGKNGKKCLLRAICDHAKVDKMHGVWGRVMDVILTPGDYADHEYTEAYKAGQYGAICTTMYPECPQGEGVFDSIFVTTNVDFVTKRGTVYYPMKRTVS